MKEQRDHCVCPSWTITLFVLFGVCITGVLGQWGELEEGQKCGTSYRDEGICKKVTDCPSAINALYKRRPHDLDRCGFDGVIEIVCCPTSEVREFRDHNDGMREQKPNLWNASGDGDDITNTHSTTTIKSTKTTSRRRQMTTSAQRLDTKRKSEIACDTFSNEVPADVEFQILGGVNANPSEFPHMAAIGYRNDDGQLEWRCGGSLISKDYILTAAHCIISAGGDEPVKVRLGKVDLSGDSDRLQPYDYDIAKATPHPGYVRRSKENDIALLKLTNSAPKSKSIHPACLYNKDDDPSPLIVTGWGYTQPGQNPSSILQKTMLNPVSVSNCNATYTRRLNKQITKNQICAGSDDGKKDACTGDSGGPLQVQQKKSSNIFSVVGITSYGTGCGGTTPAVYTRVYSYLDWIEDIVWP